MEEFPRADHPISAGADAAAASASSPRLPVPLSLNFQASMAAIGAIEPSCVASERVLLPYLRHSPTAARPSEIKSTFRMSRSVARWEPRRRRAILGETPWNLIGPDERML